MEKTYFNWTDNIRDWCISRQLYGDIVIAEIDGEFTVKRLLLRPRPALEPVSDSPEFRTLYPENICIFGIVTHVIHRTRELR